MNSSGRRQRTVVDDVDEVWKEWNSVVNLTPWEIERWLLTDRSRSVKSPALDLGGHHPSRRIIVLKATPRHQLTEIDLTHMRQVMEQIQLRLTQRPIGNVTESDWRYSLMNWGHDPVRVLDG